MLKAVSALVAAGLALAGATAGQAAHNAFSPCHGSSGVRCGRVTVPLDWSGATPGTLSLAVEMLPAKGTPKGVLAMIAGGPGQASAQAFDLADSGDFYRSQFPGYTLVAFDPRGTGNSGSLGCSVSSAAFINPDPAQVAACANLIGPARAFYSTAANVEDLDAVRQAVGVDKIALYGVSYGTKLELAYAQAHPTHVERLLLDSVLATSGPDPMDLDVLPNLPTALSSLCTLDAVCRSLLPDLAGAVAAIANKAAVKPLAGSVVSATGVPLPITANGAAILSIVRSSDLDDGIRAELPSAIAAARAGHPRQLLRLAEFTQIGFRTAASISTGALLAEDCNDGLFPWQPTDPLATRQQAFDAAVAALPAGATGPFGTWAARDGWAALCLDWPSPAGHAPLAGTELPDVPVLALSGSLDMRTPTAEAASIVAQFPQGRLLVVPGVGHDVLDDVHADCAPNAVRTWLSGGSPPSKCPAERPRLADVGRIPLTIAAAKPVRGVPGLRGRTLAVVDTTVRDALASWYMARPAAIAGLVGGTVSGAGDFAMRLFQYSDVPGVSLTGTLQVDLLFSGKGPIYRPTGTVTVSGGKAAHARIRITANGSVHPVWTH